MSLLFVGAGWSQEAGDAKKKSLADSNMKAIRGAFTENKGQWPKDVRFVSQTPGANLWVMDRGFLVDFYQPLQFGEEQYRQGHVGSIEFVGGSTRTTTSGVGQLGFKTDFLLGHKSKWAQGARSFLETTTKNLYPGIDLRIYRDGGRPRYDLIVAPGANPAQIRMQIGGLDSVGINAAGDLTLGTAIGTVSQRGLKAFQGSGASARAVKAQFKLVGKNTVAFEVGAYDRTRTLVIDPLVYGTYFGGVGGVDTINAATSDNGGNLFMTGTTQSPNLPINQGPYFVNYKLSTDSFMAALQGDAYDVTYVAYIGGVGVDRGLGVQIDQYGNVWLAGTTTSIKFPEDKLEEFIRQVPGSGTTTEGPYILLYGGQQTGPIDFAANAAAIQGELNNLPNAPAGGFTVDQGDLPGTPVRIRCDLPLGPITAFSRTNVYQVNPAAGQSQSQDIFMPDAILDLVPQSGFTPNDGFFRITFITLGNVANTTANIPFDADAAIVQAALEALPTIAPGDITVVGGPLPAAPINVTFMGALNAPQNAMQIVGTGLISGLYEVIDRAAPAYFLLRFQPSANNVLDPITAPQFSTWGSPTVTNNFSGFAVRPVPTATGAVELTIGGWGSGTLAEIPGAKPGGINGYVLNFTYNNGTNTLATVPARCKYVGGSGRDVLSGIAVDTEGAIYTAGSVENTSNIILGPGSPVFETTAGVFGNGGLLRVSDAFVRKYDTTGAVAYSAVLGGSGHDEGFGIAVDALGNAYVTGISRSFNFPRTPGAFNQNFGDSRTLFVTKVNSNGSQILYSTNLGTAGPVSPRAIVVDSKGNAYIAGIVGFNEGGPGAPTIPGSVPITPVGPAVPGQEAAIDTTYAAGDRVFPPAAGIPRPLVSTTEGFLTVLNSTATGLLYSSYIGENTSEDVLGLSVDKAGSVWAYGLTTLGPTSFFIDAPAPVPVQATYTTTTNLAPPFVANEAGAKGIPTGYISPLAFKSTYSDPGDGFIVKMRVNLPTLGSMTLNPDQIPGGLGAFSTGTVTLRAPAPAGGVQVTVRVLNPTIARLQRVGGPTSLRVTIPAGATTGTFEVYTNRVLTPTFVDIRAELDGDFIISRLSVRPWLQSMTLSTDSLPGGNPLQGTITLFAPAPAAGVQAILSTDNPALVSFPQQLITIPAGQQSFTFDVDTNGVAANTVVNISVQVEGVGITESLTLLPASVLEVTFDPPRVNGGEPAVGTVRLDGEAVASTVITLMQAGTPVTLSGVTIAAGDTEGTFDVTTTAQVGFNGAVTVTATTNGTSQSGTLFIDSNQLMPNPTGIVLSAASVLGGSVVNGQVNILFPAGPSGFTVPLLNSTPAAGTIVGTDKDGNPANNLVYIQPGATSATFVINTNVVSTTQNLTVTANKPGYAMPSATVEVRAVNISLTLNPTSVTGSQTSTGTITLGGGEVAPQGGLTVSLTSSNPAVASVPASATIPAGLTTVNFTINTSIVNSDQVITITAASTAGVPKTANLTVLAPGVITLSVQPANPTGGSLATGTVILNVNAPAGGLVINLTSSNTDAATVPATVTVPFNQKEATFTVTTKPVLADTNVNITAARGSSTRTVTITVRSSQLTNLTLNPVEVRGGETSVATITLDQPAPAGGIVFEIAVDKGQFVIHPPMVIVPEGQTTASFNLRTKQVSRYEGVKVTVTNPASGQSISATLFIRPLVTDT